MKDGRARDLGLGLAGLGLAVGALAVDHLVGTDRAPGEEGLADPGAFAIGLGVALALTAFLFGVVARRAAREEAAAAAGKAVVCSGFAVATFPLLLLAVPFPLAAAGVALGLRAREGGRRGLGGAAALVGLLVLALGASVYLVALAA